MKIEDQVCPFQQANELAGHIKLDTLWSWVILDGDDEDSARLILTEKADQEDEEILIIAAPTVAEFGIIIPCEIVTGNSVIYTAISRNGRKFRRTHQIFGPPDKIIEIDYGNEAEARANALEWLIDNNYLIAKELKL